MCTSALRAGLACRLTPHSRLLAPMARAVQAHSGPRRHQRCCWRAAAGRGGVSDDEEDEQGSRDEYYDSDDVGFEEPIPGDGDAEIRLFLDSADVKAWETWAETGLFWGFTTNPTILKRDGVPCNVATMRHLAREACALKVQELQLQAWGATAEQLYACGMDLMDIDASIVVKLPLTLEGAKAAARLVANDAPVTMTGVYAQHQVVTALSLGACYAAPYLGRMRDAGKDALDEVGKMQQIVDQSTEEGGMRLLVASIRSADEIAALAVEGCNTFTISPSVAQQLFEVKLTNDAAAVFQQHAEEMGAIKD